ncbi:MAG: crotonase/enoyl-CoA hydratase family protein [Nannocystaceae bacterium]
MTSRLTYTGGQSLYRAEYCRATRTVWGTLEPKGIPCFSVELLRDLSAHDQRFRDAGGKVEIDGELCDVDFYVLAAGTPRVFSLGGDLSLFRAKIRSADRDALARYARLCIDVMFPRLQNYGRSSLITITLVQGDALGGGLECALASDVLIAEEEGQFGLPEILFNLFPGMGAYSLLARRIGRKAAEDMMLSGRMYSARELHEMGVIDVVVAAGQGEAAVEAWISRSMRHRNGRSAIYSARRLVAPISREELDAITGVWVDAALRLTDRDLKLMERIVEAQTQRMDLGNSVEITGPRGRVL